MDAVARLLECLKYQDVSMEVRLFRLISLSIAVICLFGVLPTNLLQDLSPYLNLLILGFGLASVCSFQLSLRGIHLIKSYFLVTVAIINASWFLNGGSAGSIDYFFFPALLYPLFFLRNPARVLSIIGLLIDKYLLLLLEQSHPSWVVPYKSAEDRLIDLISGFSFSAVFCAVIFSYVVNVLEEELRERHRAEASLVTANKELDLRVQERTSRLETSLQEQEAFSYSVSHDLRAPLRHMNSYLTILEADFGSALPEEAHSLLERSRYASHRMGALIDDLLDLSKVGRSAILKERVDLTALATAILHELTELEPGRGVGVTIAPNLDAFGDKVLLFQMLENLIGNAWKYTSLEAAATIEFGSTYVDNRKVFYLRDNGVGFDMSYLESMFTAFHRLHGAEFEGNGVGLTTVKRIIDRHQGEIWAEGRVGEGATFFFTLPWGEDQSPDTVPPPVTLAA